MTHHESTRTTNASALDQQQHFDRQLFLFAFATMADVAQHVRMQGSPEMQGRLPEIQVRWLEAQAAVRAAIEDEAGVADACNVEPIPSEYTAQVSEYLGEPLFQRTFGERPTQIALVDTANLVVAQRAINLEYVERLKSLMPGTGELGALLEFCTSPHRMLDPAQHLEVGPSLHVFSSPHLDLRYLGSCVKMLSIDDPEAGIPGGLPAAAIISFVGYGAAPINAIVANGRIVLHNGLHRVYSLQSVGVTKVPMVLQSSSNPSLDFPSHIAGIPREYLLGAPRPMLATDFFRREFVLAMDVSKRLKVVTVGINIGQHDVPA